MLCVLQLPLSGFLFKFRYTFLQIPVLPLQRFDLVAAEKRTHTLGYVGRYGRGCAFQFLGLHLFLGLPEFFFCRLFPLLQFHHFRLEAVCEFLRLVVILLRGLVPCR